MERRFLFRALMDLPSFEDRFWEICSTYHERSGYPEDPSKPRIVDTDEDVDRTRKRGIAASTLDTVLQELCLNYGLNPREWIPILRDLLRTVWDTTCGFLRDEPDDTKLARLAACFGKQPKGWYLGGRPLQAKRFPPVETLLEYQKWHRMSKAGGGKLTHQQIADKAYVTRETVSRGITIYKKYLKTLGSAKM